MKNFVLFKFSKEVLVDDIIAAFTAEELQYKDFQSAGQTVAEGFVPVNKNFVYIHDKQNHLLEFKHITRKKTPSAAQVKEMMEEWMEDYITNNHSKPSTREQREYKQFIIENEILPRTFPKKTEMTIMFDFNTRFVFCGTGSADNAFDVLSTVSEFLMEKGFEKGLDLSQNDFELPFCSTMRKRLLDGYFTSDANDKDSSYFVMPNGSYTISGEGQTGENTKNSKITLKNISLESQDLMQALNGSSSRLVAAIGFSNDFGSFSINENQSFSSVNIEIPKFNSQEETEEHYLIGKLILTINSMTNFFYVVEHLLTNENSEEQTTENNNISKAVVSQSVGNKTVELIDVNNHSIENDNKEVIETNTISKFNKEEYDKKVDEIIDKMDGYDKEALREFMKREIDDEPLF